MEIRGIAHTAYNVSNIEKSLHFYTEILGFEKLFTLTLGDGRTLLYLKIGENQFVELFYGGNLPQDQKEKPLMIGYEHLCLEVSDIFSAAQELKQKGVCLTEEPSKGLDGNYQLWISDPDSNRIELMQYGEAPLQFPNGRKN